MSNAQGIKIYLRIRPPATAKHSDFLTNSTANNKYSNTATIHNNKPVQYEIETSFEESKIKFLIDKNMQEGNNTSNNVNNLINNSADSYTFRFNRVFTEKTTQADVFNTVAKSCVQSALQGYNSTIFAYGQTGSGKTYSITGGTESYEDRGLIPRALSMIYDEVNARNTNSNNTNAGDITTVSLSYLQIYNDKGQDLLNHGKDAKSLDDLPNVTIFEGDDEVVLKNLEPHYAPTLSDALNLLFLGDTNRLYCETPMNKTSSRSHCVLMIHIETKNTIHSNIKRSKLNFVDLAGSERVSKTQVSGQILTEAKYINLSLHHLEHVIVSLSELAKNKYSNVHVPYRNAFLTMVLKDSLGPNCITSMLATCHTATSVVHETLSTCRFAQRVSCIKQDAQVNEEVDPFLMVKRLKAEVAQLKDKLLFYEKDGKGSDRALSDDEKQICAELLKKFVDNRDPNSKLEGLDGDLARIYYCFDVMRKSLQTPGSGGSGALNFNVGANGGGGAQSSNGLQIDEGVVEEYKKQVEVLTITLQQKENEMNMLLDVLHKAQPPKFNAVTQTSETDESPLNLEQVRALVQHLRTEGKSKAQYMGSTTNSTTTNITANSNHGPSSPTNTQATLQHVKNLSQQGKLRQEEQQAAEEYLRGKETMNSNATSGSNGGGNGYNLGALTDAELLENRAAAFESFKNSYQDYHKLENTKNSLKAKYEACKTNAASLNKEVETIKDIKTKIQRIRAERAVEGSETVSPEEQRYLEALTASKNNYNTISEQLRKQKEEIDSIHLFIKHSQEKLTKDFEDWLSIRQKQVSLAINQGSSGNVGQAETVVNANASNTSMPTQRSSAPTLRGSVTAAGANASLSPNTNLTLASSDLQRHPSTAPGGEKSAFATSAPLGGGMMNLNNNNTNNRITPQENNWVGGLAASGAGNTANGNNTSSGRLPPLSTPTSTGTLYNNGTGGVGRAASNPPHHLTPLAGSTSLNTSTSGANVSSVSTSGGAGTFKSTGNTAADEQLAALYRAREAMRQKLL